MRRLLPNLENCSFAEIRAAEKCAASGRAHCRLMAIRLFFEGRDYDDIVSIMAVAAATLRTWIHRFNRFGIDGLTHDQERPGRPTKIPPEKHETLKDLLRNPHKIGEDFWTARKLHGFLAREWQVELGYSTVCQTMHKMGFALKSAQPWPGERQDEVLRQQFREKLEGIVADAQIDLWYTDETGIEGDPRPRRRWAERGVVTRTPYTGDHLRENVIGAVHPAGGELFAHVVPYVDREWYQLFLDGLAEQTRFKHEAGRRIVLILDNASWHKAKSLNWHHIEPMYLPPYSPDFNPIERLWLVLKARWFTNHICKSHEELAERVDQALKSFFEKPAEVQSICG
jgi:transposase